MMAARCQKFVPNIFDKSKCQTCFGPKAQHSAAAIESSKVARKVSKCGYLFVAPESFDFSNPLDRSRRWQRRFIILYDDGTLTYSVDENVDTVPQGEVDMNKCEDVVEAEDVTGHEFSVAVLAQQKPTYIKGTSKDEIGRWYDVLVMYPRSLKAKNRRNIPYPWKQNTDAAKVETSSGLDQSEHNTQSNSHERKVLNKSNSVDPSMERKSRQESYFGTIAADGQSNAINGKETSAMKFKGVRSLKHKHDRTYQENLRKANSLTDISTTSVGNTEGDSGGQQRNGIPHRERSDARRDYQEAQALRSSQLPPRPGHVRSRSRSPDDYRRSRSEAKPPVPDVVPPTAYQAGMTTDEQVTADERAPRRRRTREIQLGADNERSSRRTYKPEDVSQDLMYMKKGWLVMKAVGESDWKKHWFVLSGSALKYYRDSQAEAEKSPDGVVDISGCVDVVTAEVSKNYGFIVKTHLGDYLMSAMTGGIRSSWVQAIKKCMEDSAATNRLSAATDSGALHAHGATPDVLDSGAKVKATKILPVYQALPQAQATSEPAQLTDTAPTETMFGLPGSTKKTSIPSKTQLPGNKERLKDLGNLAKSESPPMERHIRESSVDSIGEEIARARTLEDKPPSPDRQDSKLKRKPHALGTLRRHSNLEQSSTKSPIHKAPSAKLKERSRSKSPRPRSPPPDTTDRGPAEESFDSIVRRNTVTVLPSYVADNLGEDNNWKKVEEEQQNLEQKMKEYQSRLVEEQNRADKAMQQLTEMTMTATDNKKQLSIKEKEIEELSAKLKVVCEQMDDAQKQLKHYHKKVKAEKEKSASAGRDNEAKIKKLETDIKEKEAKIMKQAQDIIESKDRFKDLEAIACKKDEEIKTLKTEKRELEKFKDKLVEKTEEVEQLEQELSRLHKETEQWEKKMKALRDDQDKQINELQVSLTKEKQEVEKNLIETQEELNQLKQQTNIAASLNTNMADILKEKDETIAQLEEKVIEHDVKIEELSEELSIEVDDNHALQQNLKEMNEDNKIIRKDLEMANEDIKKLEADVKQISGERDQYRAQVIDLGKKNDKLKEDMCTVKDRIEQLEKDNLVLEDESSDFLKKEEELNEKIKLLETDILNYQQEMKDREDEYKSLFGKYKEDHSEIEKLRKDLCEYEVKISAEKDEHNQVIEKKNKEIAAAKELNAKLEHDLSQTRSKIEAHTATIQTLQKSVEMSSRDKHLVGKANEQLEEKEKAYATAKEEIKSLKNEVEIHQGNSEQLNFTIKKLQEQLQQIEAEHEEQVDVLEAKIVDLNEKLTEMLIENAKLQKEVAAKSAMSDSDSESGLDTIKEEPMQEQQQGRVTELEERLQIVSEKWELGESIIAELQNELAQLKESQIQPVYIPPLKPDHQQLHEQVADLQQQLEQSQEAYLHCQNQIQKVLQELKSQKTNEHDAASLLEHIKQKLQGVLQDVSHSSLLSCESSEKSITHSVDPRLKLFADRLALEAVLLGKIAYLTQTSQDSACVLKSKHFVDIKLANDKIRDLEILVDALESENVSKTDEMKLNEKHSLAVFTSLVADKIIAEGELLAYIHELDITADMKQNSLTVTPMESAWITEVVSKGEASVSTDTGLTSVTEGALSQESLSRLIGIMQKDLNESLGSEGDEVHSAHHKLIDRASDISQQVDMLVKQKITEMSKYLAAEIVNNSQQETSGLLPLEKVEKSLVETVQKNVEEHKRKVCEHETNSTIKEAKLNLINTAVDRELHYCINNIKSCTQTYVEKHEKDSSLSEVQAIENCVKEKDLAMFACVLSHRAMVSGLVGYIARQGLHPKQGGELQRYDSGFHTNSPPFSQTSDENEFGENEVADALLIDSKCRQTLLDRLRGEKSDVGEHVTMLAKQLVCIDKKLEQQSKSLNFYADRIIREAISQAQLVYVVHRLEQKHALELLELEETYQKQVDELMQQKDDLSADIPDNKQDSELVTRLKADLENMKSETSRERDSLKLKYEEKQVSLMKERDQLLDDVKKLKAEHSSQASATEKQVEKLKQEISDLKKKQQAELNKLQSEMFSMSMSEESNNIDMEELNLELSRLKAQMEQERRQHQAELEKARGSVPAVSGGGDGGDAASLTSQVQQLQQQLQNVQADYEQELAVQKAAHRRELAGTKGELMQQLAAAEARSVETNEDLIKRKYTKEIERIKEMYDRGFSNMEKSHRKAMQELRRAHKRELEALRLDKEQTLQEELQATQAVLDAMKKAHNTELQTERNKFLDVMSKTYSQADMDSLQHQHEDDLDLIQNEIKQLSEQYSIKCFECATLEDRLESQSKLLQESRRRVQELLIRNEDLNSKLRSDIERLAKQLKKDSSTPVASPAKGAHDLKAVSDLQMTLKIKELEMNRMHEEIGSLTAQLQETQEELEEHREKYHDLQEQQELTKRKYEQEMAALYKRLDDQQDSDAESEASSSLQDPFQESLNEETRRSLSTPSIPVEGLQLALKTADDSTTSLDDNTSEV